ncbi:MAG: S9 family peptidase, partial [Actinobacteria bacterium]|nr:S9 family peptidase [Actinomycetota bacterium]
EGIADPDRIVLMGRSWGGYITLLGLGMHPDRFICGAAGVPVGDYIEAYVDSAPSLQAMDRALLGGAAPDLPEFVTPRSPITYVDKVRVPVHIQYGENDTRCPPRQVRLYIDALAEAGGNSEVDVYGTGHGSMVVDEEVRQWGVVLDFLSRNVPGLRPT